jgi:glycosyltransferase involved in cell wall biosynthesis
MKPLVSITMSAYNVERYLRASLDCVVNQTLRDIEILCVNDGSTDGTIGILREYAARDSRLKIVEKDVNEGLAVARNEALALASGKYVGFFDGDDLCDRDLFRKAYQCAEENHSDLVFWDYVTFRDEREVPQRVRRPSALRSVATTDKAALLRRPAFAWTKLVRTEVARELGISFPKGLTRQDIPVHWQLVTQLDRIALLPERLSYYRQHSGATTHRKDRSLMDLIIVYDRVKTFLVESGLYRQYRDVFLHHQLRAFSGVYDNIEPARQSEVMAMIHARLGKDEWQYLEGATQLPRRVLDFYAGLRGSVPAKIRRALRLSARDLYRSLGSPLASLRMQRG